MLTKEPLEPVERSATFVGNNYDSRGSDAHNMTRESNPIRPRLEAALKQQIEQKLAAAGLGT